MADGKVNLTFSTIAQLQGLNQISDGLKKSGREIKDFGDAGAQIVGTLSAQFKGPVTDAIGSVFGSLQGLARGGLWGAIAAGVGTCITKFVEWRKEIEKQREEHRKMLDEAARGYARRVASYAEKAAQKEREAYEARAKAMKGYAEAQTKMVETVVRNSNAMASADARIRAAQRRQDVANGERDELLSGNRERSETAQNAVEAARQAVWAITRKMEAGSATAGELQIAERNLAAAEAELAAVEAENAKRLRDRKTEEEVKANEELARQEDEFRKQLKAEEEERKKAEQKALKERTDAMKESAEAMRKEVSVLDQAISAQKKLADEWEENAQKIRGKDFAAWQREQSAADAAQTAEERRFGRANAEAGRRASRIRANARHGWASARDRAWLQQYDEWSAAQSAANNPYTSEAERLEAERAEKVASIDDKLGEVKKLLKDAMTME